MDSCAHPSTARGTALFFHGNAGSISDRLHRIQPYHDLNINLLLWDYRGYGASSGSPSETGLYRDAAAMWQAVQERYDIAAANTILHGCSLGGGVASWLASQDDFAGLILESTGGGTGRRARFRF